MRMRDFEDKTVLVEAERMLNDAGNHHSATAWKFVWPDGRFFSSVSRETIRSYAIGAVAYHGDNCGHIEAIKCENPIITEVMP
jgi:hypothetical protein